MINNETMQSILARRSYKVFDSRPIDDEVLETIVTAGLYAPTGMNRQPWHFTVIHSKEALEKFGAARRSLPLPPGKGELERTFSPLIELIQDGDAITVKIPRTPGTEDLSHEDFKRTKSYKAANAMQGWAYILRQWDAVQNDARPVRILTDEFGTAGPDVCDSLSYLFRLVCELSVSNGGRWFRDDGLVEGRDYEVVEDEE